jgi:hypothetical protein
LTATPKRKTNGLERGRDRRRSRAGKYVYGIIGATTPRSFGRIGIGAEPTEVYTIVHRDIAAVVSDSPLETYDPTRANVLAHARVNDAAMEGHTVIPMSFGTVFKSRPDIVELLRSAYDAFRDVLAKMQDKVEFGLKVLWEPHEVIRDLESEDETLARLKEEIRSRPGSTYFARMQYGRLVDSLLHDRSERHVADVFEALRPASVASRSDKPIGDKMIMNAAFLVERERSGAFQEAVRIASKQASALRFKCTGPWPPYNFVNIRLKLEWTERAS